MGKVRAALSECELRDYSQEHLLYEMSMLFGCAQLLRRPPAASSEPLTGILRFALIEAFVIHLRNLIDFLYPTPGAKPTDVFARDYFDAGVLPLSFPAISPELKGGRDRAHKEVQHLTLGRVAGNHPSKQWEFDRLASELFVVLKSFADSASQKKLAPGVREFIELAHTAYVNKVA